MSEMIETLTDGLKTTINVLITGMGRGVTAKGAPYLSFNLQDKSGTIDAKFWNVSEELLYAFEPGNVVSVSGDVLSHNKKLQFRIQKMEVLSDPTIDISAYVKTSAIPKEELRAQIEGFVERIENEKIKQIMVAVLAEFGKDFYAYPAATKNHHDFVGGLATHVLGMLKIADNLCTMYPLLERDLLIGGVILHDIGKLIELNGAVVSEYTMEGRLLGHISIMQAKVAQIAESLHIEGEEVILLRHMILSHHGVYEYGSPVLPMIPEAEILHLIDNIDARMSTIEKAFEGVAPQGFTQRIFALENRSFYKRK